MKLSEIFEQLTYGELSQLDIGGADQGEIAEENYKSVVAHINLGLTSLFKRFSLKQVTLPIALVQAQYSYPITATNLFKIESVTTDAGFELSLNNADDKYSVFTPMTTVLNVHPDIVDGSLELPDDLKTAGLSVMYRANHDQIVVNSTFDPYTQEIALPYSHLEALLYYVASRVNNPIGMVNEFHAGSSYAAKYEQACQQLEQQNIQVDQFSQPDRISRGGWV